MEIFSKLSELIHPERRADSICEACQKPFHCGASIKGCWCLTVQLKDGAREELRARYKHCLCPDCLGQYAAPSEE